MAPKTKKKQHAASLTEGVFESANQIWLAGLAAFAKSKREGNKLFDSLVEEGKNLQEQSRSQIENAQQWFETADKTGNKARVKLEKLLDKRLAQTLTRAGIPTQHDVDALVQKIETLEKRLKKMSKR